MYPPKPAPRFKSIEAPMAKTPPAKQMRAIEVSWRSRRARQSWMVTGVVLMIYVKYQRNVAVEIAPTIPPSDVAMMSKMSGVCLSRCAWS